MGEIFQILFFRKNSFRRVGFNIFSTILDHKQKSKILDFSEIFLSLEKSPKGKNFQIWFFRKIFFRRVGFNIFPTFLGQKLKYFFFEKNFKQFLKKIFKKKLKKFMQSKTKILLVPTYTPSLVLVSLIVSKI